VAGATVAGSAELSGSAGTLVLEHPPKAMAAEVSATEANTANVAGNSDLPGLAVIAEAHPALLRR
jgi:hypothetical protein